MVESINEKSESILKSKKDRIKTLIEYYEELSVTIIKALESNQIVDLINIFGGNFKRRSYNLNVDYNYEDQFIEICSKLGIENPNQLLEEDIFKKIGISRRSKPYYDKEDYESIYEFSAIFTECFYAEKFILNPEGLSLTSSPEELDATLIKYEQRVNDKLISIESNFSVAKGYKTITVRATEQFMNKLEQEARIELDEENKLAKEDDKLAAYFTEKTNVQLDYKMGDVDTDKCAVPYSDVDVAKIIASADIVKADPIPTRVEPKPMPPIPANVKVKPMLNTIGDEYFKEHPDKIIGEMSISDFRNMIIVKGTKQDVISYFDKVFAQKAELVKDEVNIQPAAPEPTISVESISKKIKALQILADMGDEKALRKVKALKTLI